MNDAHLPSANTSLAGALTAKDVNNLSAAAECYREALTLKLHDHPCQGRDALCGAEILLRHAAMTLMQAANYLESYTQLTAEQDHVD